MPEKITTSEEFAKNMQRIYDAWDGYINRERVHMEMDGYILEVLTELGYEDGVAIFNNTPMWYA